MFCNFLELIPLCMRIYIYMQAFRFRLVCWDLYKRGPVGETLIHLCLLLATPLTTALAKRLLAKFPKMLVDIYLSDQYYGMSQICPTNTTVRLKSVQPILQYVSKLSIQYYGTSQICPTNTTVHLKSDIHIESFNIFAGENILHIAIVNEDPAMVKFLLDRDEDGMIHHERAFGEFFSCDDQVASRKDKQDKETLKMTNKTNYKGNPVIHGCTK